MTTRSGSITRALTDLGGVARRADLQVTRGELDAAVRRRQVVRLLPMVYALAARASDPELGERAAVLHAGEGAALSHLSALRRWGLGEPAVTRIHVVVPVPRQRAGASWLRIHRSMRPIRAVERGGLPVTPLDRTVVDCWPLLSAGSRRALVLDAIGARRTTAERLAAEARATPNLKGRRELLGLLDLVYAGCRSELEIWGHLHVFAHPSLPEPRRQYRLTDGSRTVYLDIAYPEYRVAVELDGAAHHGSPEARERDLRRDTWLAARGWVVLRFSHSRLTAEPRAVRRELAAVLAARRSRRGA